MRCIKDDIKLDLDAYIHHDHGITKCQGGDIRISNNSEYKIELKNNNPRHRAVASIWIDGNKAIRHDLIINPNESVLVERFLCEDSSKNKRKFKLITATGAIKRHLDLSDYGEIEVSYQYEKNVWDNMSSYWGGVNNYSDVNVRSFSKSPLQARSGITVGGSESQQQFENTPIGALAVSTGKIHVRLIPTTTEQVRRCPSCGKEWPIEYEYCPSDGSFLCRNGEGS